MKSQPVLKADGYDAAIIGVTNSWSGDSRPLRLVYSGERILELLMRDGMTYEDALDFFNFNIADAYVGEDTPVFVWPYHEAEDYDDDY